MTQIITGVSFIAAYKALKNTKWDPRFKKRKRRKKKKKFAGRAKQNLYKIRGKIFDFLHNTSHCTATEEDWEREREIKKINCISASGPHTS